MQNLKTLSARGLLTAVLIASTDAIKKYHLQPRARIHSFTVVGSDPVIVVERPIIATKKLLKKTGLAIEDIDLNEVNEAIIISES